MSSFDLQFGRTLSYFQAVELAWAVEAGSAFISSISPSEKVSRAQLDFAERPWTPNRFAYTDTFGRLPSVIASGAGVSTFIPCDALNVWGNN